MLTHSGLVTGKQLPDHLKILLNTSLAATHFQEGNLDNSRKHVREAISEFSQLAPNAESFERMKTIAVLCSKLQMYDEAEKVILSYLEYVDREPGNRTHRRIISIRLLSEIYQQAGNNEESERIRSDYFQGRVREQLQQSPYEEIEFTYPEKWGADDFTQYIGTAECNTVSSTVLFENLSQALKELNAKFHVARESGELYFCDLINEKYGSPKLSELQLSDAERLEFFLFMRTHSCLISAARLSLGAHIPESYCLIRAAIEHAVYAYSMAKDENKKQIWLNRNTNKDAVKKSFVWKMMIDSLILDYPELGTDTKRVYELCIDEGAHPNASSFFKHALQRNEPKALALGLIYLDTDYVSECTQHVLEAGNLCLRIFKVIYPQWIW